ncbi:glycosyltransferase [Aquicoccus sp.]|uniref:glycosyltransferase n=1 Tax=Aquicoccus sp. TaxID=2055851 RepID=UPI0035645DCE
MTAPPDHPVPGSDRPHKLVVFGFDAAEAAQRRRIRAYMECGFEVSGFTMRRANMTHDAEPFWPNVDLGQTRNAAMAQRIWRILAALPILWRHHGRLAGARTIVARNLDMLIIAAAARRMMRPRPRLVYEVLDIHDIMTDGGPGGRLARRVERSLLKRTDAIIVSSPAFEREYFGPVQAWTGDVKLLENKLWIGEGVGPDRPAPDDARTPGRPFVLGWVGTLRCPKSLDILLEMTDRLGSGVELRLHGIVHHHMLPDFEQVVAARANVTCHGPYDYPDGLEQIYRGCDAVWVQDLWQWGTNSTWLLPNRIYEAGYFGCPSIAVAGTETGRRVARGLGWTVPEPTADALVSLLRSLSPEEIVARRRALLAMPENSFRQSPEEITSALLP